MEGTSQKLLVIDDDSKLNRLLTDYLGGMGFQVLTAIKPSEGLKFLEREKPDLVILDIMLPEMDGLEPEYSPSYAGRETAMMKKRKGFFQD